MPAWPGPGVSAPIRRRGVRILRTRKRKLAPLCCDELLHAVIGGNGRCGEGRRGVRVWEWRRRASEVPGLHSPTCPASLALERQKSVRPLSVKLKYAGVKWCASKNTFWRLLPPLVYNFGNLYGPRISVGTTAEAACSHSSFHGDYFKLWEWLLYHYRLKTGLQ